jgi:hypothetical protein
LGNFHKINQFFEICIKLFSFEISNRFPKAPWQNGGKGGGFSKLNGGSDSSSSSRSMGKQNDDCQGSEGERKEEKDRDRDRDRPTSSHKEMNWDNNCNPQTKTINWMCFFCSVVSEQCVTQLPANALSKLPRKFGFVDKACVCSHGEKIDGTEFLLLSCAVDPQTQIIIL